MKDGHIYLQWKRTDGSTVMCVVDDAGFRGVLHGRIPMDAFIRLEGARLFEELKEVAERMDAKRK